MLMFYLAQCDEIESDADNEVMEIYLLPEMRFRGKVIPKRIQTINAASDSGVHKREAFENIWQKKTLTADLM